MEYFDSTDYNNYNLIHTDYITKNTCIEQIQASKIFISRSHAGVDEDESFIQLYEAGTVSELYSSDIYNFSTNESMVDFSGVELLLFVGCRTAYGRATGKNLINASVSAGADCALGFEEKIKCVGANTWTSYFCKYYSQGFSVESAALDASEDTSDEHFILEFLGVLNTDSYYIANKTSD